MLHLSRFSLGMGDRFAHQAHAQLAACAEAARLGVQVTPVWNKSNREHTLIGSEPAETRAAADRAVRDLGWNGTYFVDADHITLSTVRRFLRPCDFFTIDVAAEIGQPAEPDAVDAFVTRHMDLCGLLTLPGIQQSFQITPELVRSTANRFLAAVQQAGRIYRVIAEEKGRGRFIAEISMDETDTPQSPVELLVILAAVADEQIPIQTIAPRFSGRFNKGVDYVGDLAAFEREFSLDLATIAYAGRRFDLPADLKLSLHSGSDKFSLYPILHRVLQRSGAGLHLKTAGTTWLEELIGLAEVGGDGLLLVKEIYRDATVHLRDLTAPYASVINIDASLLPSVVEVDGWTGEQFVSALRHDREDPPYNPNFRQLLHVAFKIAAALGGRFHAALESHQEVIGRNVTTNLFERHIRPVFLGS